MLSLLLGVLATTLGLALYLTAVLVPALSRSVDLLGSGLLMFYGLVLWFCAERITGALLLGQMGAIALLSGMAWQVLLTRWSALTLEQQEAIRSGETLQQQWQSLKQFNPGKLLPRRPQPEPQGAAADEVGPPATAPSGEAVPERSAQISLLASLLGGLGRLRDNLQGRKQHGKRWVRSGEEGGPLDADLGNIGQSPGAPSTALVYVPGGPSPGAEYLETLEAAIAELTQLRPSFSAVEPVQEPQEAEVSPTVPTLTPIVPDESSTDLEVSLSSSETEPESQAASTEQPVSEQPDIANSSGLNAQQESPAAEAVTLSTTGERWSEFWATELAMNKAAIAPPEPVQESKTEKEVTVKAGVATPFNASSQDEFEDLPEDLEDDFLPTMPFSALPDSDDNQVPVGACDLMIISRLTDLIELDLTGAIAQPTAQN